MDEQRLARLTGHTDGPWIPEEPRQYSPEEHAEIYVLGPLGYCGDADDRRVIVSVVLTGSGLPDEEAEKYAADAAEDEANARLIAAAPELLADVRRLRAVATRLLLAMPDAAIEEARECWGNTNAGVVREARQALAEVLAEAAR